MTVITMGEFEMTDIILLHLYKRLYLEDNIVAIGKPIRLE